jgi:hypothetical protein
LSTGRPGRAARRPLGGRRVFLSSSIPVRGWQGDYEPLEITDAVVACVSAIWIAGGKILYGGHPAIAPLLLSVAQDFRPEAEENQASAEDPLVTVYQSSLYESLIPAETRHLEAARLGRIRFIPAAPGELPERGRNLASLDLMRQAMLARENDPAFALFIGGMEGIVDEYRQFRTQFPGRPVYPIGAPGGEARKLAADLGNEPYRLVNRTALLHSAEYGTLIDDILADAIARIG